MLLSILPPSVDREGEISVEECNGRVGLTGNRLHSKKTAEFCLLKHVKQ